MKMPTKLLQSIVDKLPPKAWIILAVAVLIIALAVLCAGIGLMIHSEITINRNETKKIESKK